MESAAERPLADETLAEPRGELDDGEAVGNRFARFWHDVQSLPAGDFAGNPIVWRVAPLHSGAGEFDGSANRGSAHFESGKKERKVELRNRANDPGVL